MGAGVPLKTRKTKVYRLLKATQRELLKAGVSVAYRKQQLYLNDVANKGGGFNIRYNWLFASNGECAARPVIYIQPPNPALPTENYGGWGTSSLNRNSFEDGIERLKQLFYGSGLDYSHRCECGAAFDTIKNGFSCAKL